MDRTRRRRDLTRQGAEGSGRPGVEWNYDRLLLDLVPGPAGSVGQVISRIDVDLARVSGGFRELLERTASGLEDGTIAFERRPTELGGQLESVYRTRRGKPVHPARYFSA